MAKLNAGKAGPVALTLKHSHLEPNDVSRTGIETEIVLLQEAPAQRNKPDYLHGEVDMPLLDCRFRCTPDVYVPRSESIVMVDRISRQLMGRALEGKTFWDVGSGAGVVGIAIKKRFPKLRVICSDLSPKASELFRENARINDVQVDAVTGDLFRPFGREKADFTFFYPPQTTARSSFWAKHRTYSEYPVRAIREPVIAFESGVAGLALLERFCAALHDRLRPHGTAWIYIGGDRYCEVVNWLSESFVCHAEVEGAARRMLWWFTRRG